MTNSEPKLSRYLHTKAAKQGFPCAASFELTPRCNFHCKMCYVHLSAEEQRRRGQELTAAQWIALGEQACREGVVFLLLTGGEPTLRPDFPEIYTALKKMGLMLSVNTNGYLLRGALLDLFRENPPFRINLSLYGTSNAAYEKMCGVAAYDTIMENIRSLREAGVDIKLNMSLTENNRAELLAVYEQAQALGVHTQAAAYMFPPVRVTGQFGGRDSRMTPEDAARCEVEYDRLRMPKEQFLAHADRLEQGLGAAEAQDCEGLPGTGGEMLCRAGRSSFWLAWNGRLSPCGMLPEPSADALSPGIHGAWTAVRDAVLRIRLPAQCAVCAYRAGCHVCAAVCYCESGRFDGKPEYMCEMTKSVYALTGQAAQKETKHED